MTINSCQQVETKIEGIYKQVFKPSVLEKYPVSEEHIGKPVKFSQELYDQFILEKIHQPGTNWFPDGGYSLRPKGAHCVVYADLDQVAYVPPSPPKKRRKRRTKAEIAREKAQLTKERKEREPVTQEEKPLERPRIAKTLTGEGKKKRKRRTKAEMQALKN